MRQMEMLTAKIKYKSLAVVVFSISSKTGGVKIFLIMWITELLHPIRQFYIQGSGLTFEQIDLIIMGATAQ